MSNQPSDFEEESDGNCTIDDSSEYDGSDEDDVKTRSSKVGKTSKQSTKQIGRYRFKPYQMEMFDNYIRDADLNPSTETKLKWMKEMTAKSDGNFENNLKKIEAYFKWRKNRIDKETENRKRPWTSRTFDRNQENYLEVEYQLITRNGGKPIKKDHQRIAEHLGKREDQVKSWFVRRKEFPSELVYTNAPKKESQILTEKGLHFFMDEVSKPKLPEEYKIKQCTENNAYFRNTVARHERFHKLRNWFYREWNKNQTIAVSQTTRPGPKKRQNEGTSKIQAPTGRAPKAAKTVPTPATESKHDESRNSVIPSRRTRRQMSYSDIDSDSDEEERRQPNTHRKSSMTFQRAQNNEVCNDDDTDMDTELRGQSNSKAKPWGRRPSRYFSESDDEKDWQNDSSSRLPVRDDGNKSEERILMDDSFGYMPNIPTGLSPKEQPSEHSREFMNDEDGYSENGLKEPRETLKLNRHMSPRMIRHDTSSINDGPEEPTGSQTERREQFSSEQKNVLFGLYREDVNPTYTTIREWASTIGVNIEQEFALKFFPEEYMPAIVYRELGEEVSGPYTGIFNDFQKAKFFFTDWSETDDEEHDESVEYKRLPRIVLRTLKKEFESGIVDPSVEDINRIFTEIEPRWKGKSSEGFKKQIVKYWFLLERECSRKNNTKIVVPEQPVLKFFTMYDINYLLQYGAERKFLFTEDDIADVSYDLNISYSWVDHFYYIWDTLTKSVHLNRRR